MRYFFFILMVIFLGEVGNANGEMTVRETQPLMTDKSLGNCIACHALPGVNGTQSTFAPSLHDAGDKWTRDELKQWVSDARKINPHTLMPAFGTTKGMQWVNSNAPILNLQQIEAVVETLSSWRSLPLTASVRMQDALSPLTSISQKSSTHSFLTDDLLELQNDVNKNTISLWTAQGSDNWKKTTPGKSCSECHGHIDNMRNATSSHPRWSSFKQKLINIEDQILICSQRTGAPFKGLESDEVVSLSALIHSAGKGMSLFSSTNLKSNEELKNELRKGEKIYKTRIGRMNLACTNCHDQKVGQSIQQEVISEGHPAGFPILKMSWQGMGTIDRRIRACFSGVQAQVPSAGSPVLRQLELFMKFRSSNNLIEGPSIRR